MDYEKAYKDALERAKQIKEGKGSWGIIADLSEVKPVLDEIFPELKESEDERIRKELIDFFSDSSDSDTFRGISPSKIIAWLEKQDKKSEWSEEDKLNHKQAIYVCHQNGYTAVENWLKSLKPQSHWKPTEEQLNVLQKAILSERDNKDTFYFARVLESLHNDLLKL